MRISTLWRVLAVLTLAVVGLGAAGCTVHHHDDDRGPDRDGVRIEGDSDDGRFEVDVDD